MGAFEICRARKTSHTRARRKIAGFGGSDETDVKEEIIGRIGSPDAIPVARRHCPHGSDYKKMRRVCYKRFQPDAHSIGNEEESGRGGGSA